jgi:hypothetical protein
LFGRRVTWKSVVEPSTFLEELDSSFGANDDRGESGGYGMMGTTAVFPEPAIPPGHGLKGCGILSPSAARD